MYRLPESEIKSMHYMVSIVMYALYGKYSHVRIIEYILCIQGVHIHVGGSSKIQILSQDSSCIEIEVYNNERLTPPLISM